MDIKEIAEDAFATAQEKGWYENGSPQIPERLCLIHSEISEALEEFRKNDDLRHTYSREKDGKPEGFLVEIADAIIRIGDMVEAEGLTDDLVRAIKLKMDFNRSRPYRHGGKNC